MSEESSTSDLVPFSSPWLEASERLRSTARMFVVSLGAVALTVVGGLSLTGLSTLEPGSTTFTFAIIGALLATMGIVIMLALAMRLSSASVVSMAELIELSDSPASGGLRWKQRTRRGNMHALNVVGNKSNGYLAGYLNLSEFNDAVAAAYLNERLTVDAAANSPNDSRAYKEYVAARGKADWYDSQLSTLIEVASFQRLRWNFAATSGWMIVAGACTAIGIVTYAAALQPRDVPSSPVAVTTHENIEIKVPESKSAAALYEKIIGCKQNVRALVLGVDDASVSAVTIPESTCRSVTLNAIWDGSGYTAKFDLPKETEETQPSALS